MAGCCVRINHLHENVHFHKSFCCFTCQLANIHLFMYFARMFARIIPEYCEILFFDIVTVFVIEILFTNVKLNNLQGMCRHTNHLHGLQAGTDFPFFKLKTLKLKYGTKTSLQYLVGKRELQRNSR